MPVAPIDEQDTQLYYEDSGALPGLYTTIVIVHGAAIHGAIFSRMFPHAAAHNLRLVTLNRRDYPGSTPFTDEDLRIVNGTDVEAGRVFLRHQSLGIVTFLAWFVRREDIPPVQSALEGRDTGGLILMSWSAGWAHVAPMLSDASTFPADLTETLDPYIRGICAYGAPRCAMGMPPFEGANFYQPTFDDSLTLEEYGAYFPPWASGYYLHPDISSRRADGLTDERLENPPAGKRATCDRMTVAEKTAVTCVSAVQRLERPLMKAPVEFFLGSTYRLFKKHKSAVWPRCNLYVLWGEESAWECVMAAWYFQDLYTAEKAKGEVGRELLIQSMPGCNNFSHWDSPELTCRVFSEFLR